MSFALIEVVIVVYKKAASIHGNNSYYNKNNIISRGHLTNAALPLSILDMNIIDLVEIFKISNYLSFAYPNNLAVLQNKVEWSINIAIFTI